MESSGVERAGSLFTEFAVDPRCEACLASTVKHHPTSRRSGSVIYQCPRCGLRGLSTRPKMEALAEFAGTQFVDEVHLSCPPTVTSSGARCARNASSARDVWLLTVPVLQPRTSAVCSTDRSQK